VEKNTVQRWNIQSLGSLVPFLRRVARAAEPVGSKEHPKPNGSGEVYTHVEVEP
jgi:hypothetical protein